MADDHDRRLLSHVRPPDWRNPDPKPVYDLAVIGGGTAGLVCAAGAAALGARVAIVERARLGGDCLNSGCVPSKALLRSARAAGEARAAAAVGVQAEARASFAAVMERLRARRADIAPADSAARLASLGVDVFFGTAAFTGRRSIGVVEAVPPRPAPAPSPSRRPAGAAAPGGTIELRFRRAVIATGSRAAVPAIPGLRDAPFLTNETIFELTEQPRALIVIGGGPVGCELAQAFVRLGTRVTLIEAGPRLLPREDGRAAEIVAASLHREGVAVRLGAAVRAVAHEDGAVTADVGGERFAADALLVAAGRQANVEGLDLEAAGVAYGGGGVAVDDRLRTTNPRIYASGDVCTRLRYTHAADACSRIVVQNALFFGRRRASALTIPWCTFTSPEVAQVGLTGEQAMEAGAETIEVPLAHVDRAVLDEAAGGFVRVHHRRGRILGATIVAPQAGELIGTVALAMRHGIGLADLAGAVFPYPTLSLALRQAGDAYRRQSLTPAVRRALGYYFGWRRV